MDTNAPAIAVYDKSKKHDSYYIPQALCPVITREYIASKDKYLSKKVDEYTKLSMGKRLGIIKSFLQTLNYNGTVIEPTPAPRTGNTTDFRFFFSAQRNEFI
ncbi:MAG: hypothetical protein K2I80_11470 [Ruminococcus sp.]|nr:hypothetical protein [Ruminococcus sp.]